MDGGPGTSARRDRSRARLSGSDCWSDLSARARGSGRWASTYGPANKRVSMQDCEVHTIKRTQFLSGASRTAFTIIYRGHTYSDQYPCISHSAPQSVGSCTCNIPLSARCSAVEKRNLTTSGRSPRCTHNRLGSVAIRSRSPRFELHTRHADKRLHE